MFLIQPKALALGEGINECSSIERLRGECVQVTEASMVKVLQRPGAEASDSDMALASPRRQASVSHSTETAANSLADLLH